MRRQKFPVLPHYSTWAFELYGYGMVEKGQSP